MTQEDSIPYTFIVDKVINQGNIRKIIEYEYNVNKDKIIDTSITYFKVTNIGVYKLKDRNDKLGICLLTTKKDTCIEINHPDIIMNSILFSKYCFVGETTLKRRKVYEFFKTTGTGDGVKLKVYYDKSFILLKEEYTSGNCPYFKKEITVDIPKKLEMLMNKK